MKAWVCGRGSLENELGFTYCFDWELLWSDFTMMNKFSAEDKCPWICADKVFQSVEQQVPKGLKLNFQKSLMTYLQQQIHTTNFQDCKVWKNSMRAFSKKKSGWIFFSKKLQIYVIFYCFIGTSVILTDWKMFSPYVWCRRDRENSVFNTMTMKALC